MNIVKFENFSSPDYPTEFTGFKGSVYFVTTKDDGKPWERPRYYSIDSALEALERLQKIATSEYCIYESIFQPLTKEEVETRKAGEKYNI